MRREWRDWWPAIAVIVLVAAVVVVCLLASSASGAGRPPRPGFGASRTLAMRGTVESVSATGGSVYLAVAPPTSGRDTLQRIDPRTGEVLARRALGENVDGSLEDAGSLWVVTTSVVGRAPGSTLWRLDPLTLAVESTQRLPGPRTVQIGGQPLAAAGGHLWLGDGGSLVAIDPATGTFGAPLRLAGARDLGVLAMPGGRTLLVSAGDGSGRGWIEERDAATGTVQATSPSYAGVTLPRLGGVTGGRLWITEATGMMGYAQAVSLRTLRPIRTPALPRFTTNGIDAQVAGDVLVISQDGGGRAANYCGDPVTGAARVTLPATAQRGIVLAVTTSWIFYRGPSTPRAPEGPLDAAAVPAGCR